ncbi:hypothetical protein ACHAP7_011139 [Fusarium lateritium]
MRSRKLLSLALSLFVAESVVAGPCKPLSSATGSIVSTTLSESTTTMLPVPSSTDSKTSNLDTTISTSQASTATDTSEAKTDAATTLAASATATAAAELIVTTEAFCAQTTVLANPTPIFDGHDGRVYDDSFRTVEVPFSVGVFGSYSTTVYVSTNGVLSLEQGSTAFINRELPSNAVPPISIMPYWDDLYILDEEVCSTGITYEVHETSRGNTFTVEYYLGSGGDISGTTDHFTVSFYEQLPGLVRYVYYKTLINGQGATVGLQNGQLFSQFSYNSAGSIPDQFYIEIDTSSGDAITTSGQL